MWLSLIYSTNVGCISTLLGNIKLKHMGLISPMDWSNNKKRLANPKLRGFKKKNTLSRCRLSKLSESETLRKTHQKKWSPTWNLLVACLGTSTSKIYIYRCIFGIETSWWLNHPRETSNIDFVKGFTAYVPGLRGKKSKKHMLKPPSGFYSIVRLNFKGAVSINHWSVATSMWPCKEKLVQTWFAGSTLYKHLYPPKSYI